MDEWILFSLVMVWKLEIPPSIFFHFLSPAAGTPVQRQSPEAGTPVQRRDNADERCMYFLILCMQYCNNTLSLFSESLWELNPNTLHPPFLCLQLLQLTLWTAFKPRQDTTRHSKTCTSPRSRTKLQSLSCWTWSSSQEDALLTLIFWRSKTDQRRS